MATLNKQILSVPFLLYEVSFIYIHNNLKKTYIQVILYLNSKSSGNNQSGVIIVVIYTFSQRQLIINQSLKQL